MKRLAVVLLSVAALQAADTRVAPEGQLRDQLFRYLTAQAEQHWEAREIQVASLDTSAKVQERQEYIRRTILQQIGGFPAKTPLNARITGGFTRDGYRVEHLVFESQPKFYVTANIYVPTTGQAPFPAVLGVAGHSDTGKAINTYQHAWIGMVKRGFLVLAFDPPGQGERSEYFDKAQGKSAIGIGVAEHNMAGTQCLLTGTTLARYETWDGIRAFDYLLTRKDVDPRRIAVAGNSGGGTQAAYLAVLEPRLAASVISCYMTNWEQLWQTPGPQDAEQNFPGFLSAGLNFGDFMIAFAPKPVTMLTGIRDYFPIAGARNTYAEVKKVFGTMDAQVHAGYFEYDDEHGWHKPRREATYRWLTKWMQGKDDDGTEPAITPEPDAALNVTPTGQVATSLGGETVASLNRKQAETLFPTRRAASLEDPAAIRFLLSQTLRLRERSGVPVVTAMGTDNTPTVRTQKLLIETEPGVQVPLLLHAPPAPGRYPAVLYLNAAGKAADPDAIAKLVQGGNIVLAFDPRGWGESAPASSSNSYSAEWQLAQRALLIGKPLIGMQVHDVLRVFDYAATNPEIDPARISLTGLGKGGVLALYAAALQPRIASVTSHNALASYMTLARAATHTGLIGIVIPGVLQHFDLPDIAAAIAPRPLTLISARDAIGNPLTQLSVQSEYASAAKRYADAKQAAAFRLVAEAKE